MAVQVKICGLTTQSTVDAAVTHGADWLGFVAYPPSPRYITAEKITAITSQVPSDIPLVLVGVDLDDEALSRYTEHARIDMILEHFMGTWYDSNRKGFLIHVSCVPELARNRCECFKRTVCAYSMLEVWIYEKVCVYSML